jgi:hypothetical protein
MLQSIKDVPFSDRFFLYIDWKIGDYCEPSVLPTEKIITEFEVDGLSG